ncbi:MAG: sulfatase [Chloroflexia bacterium]|nr:sulfatase [Chloroflexia bacterium]
MTSRRFSAGKDRPISRRTVVQSLGAGSLGLLASCGRGAAASPAPASVYADAIGRQQRSRPNIILILLDDLRYDDVSVMPAVQSLLVDQGASFSNYMTTTPGCAPARASILRGQYQHNHGVMRSQGPVGGFERFHALGHERSTVATWLQDAGYTTALIGKYLNHYPTDDKATDAVAATYRPPGWDEWAGVTDEGYYKIEVNENGQLTRYRGEGQYSTDVFAAMAVDFVARTAPTGQPFFLNVAPRAPHGPAEPATRHLSALAGTIAPRPPSYNEADVSDKPAWVQAIPPLSDEQIAQLDEYHLARLRTLLAVDELVANLVEALSNAGVLDSTYILLTSDNGYHLGEHRASLEKGSPYEEVIRMPLLVRGPDVPAGRTIEAVASHADLAPTFAAWAGASTPGFVDGRSLAPLLDRGPIPADWREAVLIEHYADRTEESKKQPGFSTLRGKDFTYVEYSTGERELYDLRQDPYQLDNLAATADPAYMRGLSRALASRVTCAGEACRTSDAARLPKWPGRERGV